MSAGEPAVLSLDIGGTKLAVGVVTSDGAVHGLLVEPTRREQGPDAIISRLFGMGRSAIARAGLEVAAVGISCGGPLDSTRGILLSPPHLPGWIDIPLGDMARAEFGVPAFLENDATAAALGEHRFGAGKGVSTMLYLTISTGVGGGSVIHGKLHRGAAGNGGELGHVVVRPGGRMCSCGRRGCLEAYVSGTSIAERAAEALASGEVSTLADADPLTSVEVADAARADDQLARRIWDETTDVLGQAVTDLVNIFEPELVILGGGVTRTGSMLLEPVAEVVGRDAMPPAAKSAQVVLAGLGDVVCVAGAGVVAFDALTGANHG
ncbi:ROK family protein [Phytoactinopolyspora mesophila]|uniref:ROK family protein n=1 Tax=Phytoactinopolyspora mesophila TaxID=2650750 RepID=A0A7K3MB37_9ACTN|nr:ROK family protein [Phytoactinopolyspora mesophila]NDL60503.1 ROK family protein [Phytoactinopolyspora mesophila]